MWKIGDVFNKIHCAHKAYADAAEALVELSTEVTPEQFTILLSASIMPTIQIIVPNQLISPLAAPPPPQLPASMALGRSEIIKFTKLKVLPNPDASALTPLDENSATRVLAAAVYCKLEHLFLMRGSPELISQWLFAAYIDVDKGNYWRRLQGWSTQIQT